MKPPLPDAMSRVEKGPIMKHGCVILADRLQDTLEDGGLIESRAAAGRRRVEEEYDWDRIAEAVAAFYSEVLEKRRSRRG